MKGNTNKEKENKKKSFFAGLFEKLDTKMKEKSMSKPCSCNSTDKEKNSCCS